MRIENQCRREHVVETKRTEFAEWGTDAADRRAGCQAGQADHSGTPLPVFLEHPLRRPVPPGIDEGVVGRFDVLGADQGQRGRGEQRMAAGAEMGDDVVHAPALGPAVAPPLRLGEPGTQLQHGGAFGLECRDPIWSHRFASAPTSCTARS